MNMYFVHTSSCLGVFQGGLYVKITLTQSWLSDLFQIAVIDLSHFLKEGNYLNKPPENMDDDDEVLVKIFTCISV